MSAVVVEVTPSLTMQMTDQMDTRWKATCPTCKWKMYSLTRTEAERLLHNHLGTHNTEQGEMFA